MATRQQQADEATDTAVAPANLDHVADWLDELNDVLANIASLPTAARATLLSAINAFEAEDGGLPPAAQRARDLLLARAESNLPPQSAEPAGTARTARPRLSAARAALPA